MLSSFDPTVYNVIAQDGEAVIYLPPGYWSLNGISQFGYDWWISPYGLGGYRFSNYYINPGESSPNPSYWSYNGAAGPNLQGYYGASFVYSNSSDLSGCPTGPFDFYIYDTGSSAMATTLGLANKPRILPQVTQLGGAMTAGGTSGVWCQSTLPSKCGSLEHPLLLWWIQVDGSSYYYSNYIVNTGESAPNLGGWDFGMYTYIQYPDTVVVYVKAPLNAVVGNYNFNVQWNGSNQIASPTSPDQPTYEEPGAPAGSCPIWTCIPVGIPGGSAPYPDPNGNMTSPANMNCWSGAPSPATGGSAILTQMGTPCPTCPPNTTAIQTCGGLTIVGNGCQQLPCPLIPM